MNQKIYSMSDRPEISVVIPCLNEAQTLKKVIEEAFLGIRSTGFTGEIIIADNGSTDGSQDIAHALGARVVPVVMRGYGAAVDEGIRSALGRYVVFGDADCSYPFLEIPKLVAPLRESQAEFVLGTRLGGTMQEGAMPFLHRYLGTPVLSWLIRLLFKIPVSDCNSGMRAFLRDKYESLILTCPGMEFATEMIVRVAQVGLRYMEVPIFFRKDERGGRAPHLKTWRDGWRNLRFIVASGPSQLIIGVPLFFSMMAMIAAYFISYGQYWNPEGPLHYHTAFMILALSIPALLLVLVATLVKFVFYYSGKPDGRYIRVIERLLAHNVPFWVAVVLYGVTFFEVMRLFLIWKIAGWHNISEIDILIRILVNVTVATFILVFDAAIGMLQLVPIKRR